MVTYVKFIFFNKNQISGIADMAVVCLLILIVFLVFRLDNYYKKLNLLDEFNTTTLGRFSSILYNRNNIQDNE